MARVPKWFTPHGLHASPLPAHVTLNLIQYRPTILQTGRFGPPFTLNGGLFSETPQSVFDDS